MWASSAGVKCWVPGALWCYWLKLVFYRALSWVWKEVGVQAWWVAGWEGLLYRSTLGEGFKWISVGKHEPQSLERTLPQTSRQCDVHCLSMASVSQRRQ